MSDSSQIENTEEMAALPEAKSAEVEQAALSDQYVLDTPYVWQYYPSQAPTSLRAIALMRGFAAKPVDGEFTYCELGCGQGVTANLLAAAMPQGRFTAVDINPEHIGNARRLATEGGLENIEFLENDVADLIERDDFPPFDYITLHGVLSWVGPEVRENIRTFIARNLAPQGLVYMSYNAMPGWAPLMPLREIMLRYAETADQTSLNKAVKGLQYLKFLRDRDAAFFRATPAARPFLEQMLKADPNYVVHEYFNAHFEPMYFSDVARPLAEAGLTFLGSTRAERNFSDVIVPEAFRSLLETADNEIVRETHKSLILNEMFRRDIYCRSDALGAGRAGPELLEDAVIGAVRPASEIRRNVRFGQNEIRLKDPVYDALIAVAAPGRLTVKELYSHPDLASRSPEAIRAALQRLLVTGQFRLFARRAIEIDGALPERFRIAAAYNRAFLEERLYIDQQVSLASPVLGGGVTVDIMQGTLLLAGDSLEPGQLVDAALERLAAEPRKWVVGDRNVEAGEELRPVIEEQVKAFREVWMPLLYQTGIVEAA